MEEIYRNGQYHFYLVFTGGVRIRENPDGKLIPARMQVIREEGGGHSLTLMDYRFPPQLIPDVHVSRTGEMTRRDEHGQPVLSFSLNLEVHHISGMVQGEFTEEQFYEVSNPFAADIDDSRTDFRVADMQTIGDKRDRLVCIVTDIVRKTRFAASGRHLEHLPRQTYPPIDGRQGPYGHPTIRNIPPIPKRKHIDPEN